MYKTNLAYLLLGGLISFIIIQFSNNEEENKKESANQQMPLATVNSYTTPTDESSFNNNEGEAVSELTQDSKEESLNTQIMSDIKQKMCIAPEGDCTIKESISIEDEILDNSLKLAKSKEIGIFLSSSNFIQVIEELARLKTSNEFIELEYELNQQLITSYSEIDSLGIYCSDIVCGASFSYEEQADWDKFQNKFFSENKNLGNLFITHLANETRVMFLPDEESKGVIE